MFKNRSQKNISMFNRMFTKCGTGAAVLLVCLSLTVGSTLFDEAEGNCQVLNNQTAESSLAVLPVCSEQSSVSWFSWLTGNSSSYQFHFLDLLELLS